MHERIIVGNGYFWDVEAAFRQITGMLQTQAGYAGIHTICLLAARYVERIGFKILSH